MEQDIKTLAAKASCADGGAEPARATRWIRIGRVRLGHYMFLGNCGFPNCMVMEWRWRTHVLQSFEFRNWRQVERAVEKRLAIAGLRLETLACGWPAAERNEWDGVKRVELRAEVSRKL